MRNSAITDRSFDSNATLRYELSVVFCDHYCSYAILDPARMKFVAFREIGFDEKVEAKNQADRFRDIIIGDRLLNQHYHSSRFMYLTPLSVLVPARHFTTEDPEAFFRFSAPLLPGEQVLYRKVPAIDAFTVYSIPESLYKLTGILLNDVRFFHQSCALIGEAIAGAPGPPASAKVLASVNPGFMDILVIRDGGLLLFNSFRIRNTSDLAFFILYLYDQFGLSQEETPVELTGYIHQYPGAIDLLKDYVPKAGIRGLPEAFAYGHLFGDHFPSRHSPLIYLARCE